METETGQKRARGMDGDRHGEPRGVEGGSQAAVASAPGKVILFGEHFVVHGGKTISCAIDRRVTVRASESKNIEIHSDIGRLECSPNTYDTSEIAGRPLRPIYDIITRASRQAGYEGGMTLNIKSEIPPGAGLGSSSACCVAASAATLRLLGADADMHAIIRMAIDAERTIYPSVSGADTAASALGGMTTYDTASGYERIGNGSGFGLVVSNSGIIHDTKGMVGQVSELARRDPEGFGEKNQKESEVVSEALLLLSENPPEEFAIPQAGHPAPGSPQGAAAEPQEAAGAAPTLASRLGRLASLNQKYLRAIRVSNERIDCMVREMDGVTYGSKITGAGGGGCVIAFTEEARAEEAAGTLARMGHDCFAAGVDRTGLNTF